MSYSKSGNAVINTELWNDLNPVKSVSDHIFEEAIKEMQEAREKKQREIDSERAKNIMHDVTVTPGIDHTIIEWWYKRSWGRYNQRHVVSKILTMNEMSEICKKVQTDWAKDIQAGRTIEEMLMMDLL